MSKKYKIMLVVGEASGDSHATKLVRAIRENSSDVEIEFFGATGEKMRKVGVRTIVKADDFARVGILEVATALPMFLKVFKQVKESAKNEKPDLAILIDFPDFNLKLAKALKKQGVKVVYYISPQVWAWKKYRVNTLKKYVDLLLTILPFEKDWYAKQGFDRIKYVGNPLAGEVHPKISKTEFCKKHELDEQKPIIALLTGSRRNEIERILPVLVETASLMFEKNKNLQFVVPLASARKFSEVEKALDKAKAKNLNLPKKFVVIKNETYEALNAADVAAVTSGTATLETAIIGTPFAIVYKISKLNYSVLRHFISVEFIGLVNLIARKKVVQEFIQDDFSAENLSAELFRLLEKDENVNMRENLAEIKKSLGVGGASKLAAQAVLEMSVDSRFKS